MTSPTAHTLTLPYPPSLNHYWRAVNGRMLISKAGREYRQAVGYIVLGTRIRKMDGRLQVSIYVYPPDRRRRDLDNIQKPLLDALEHAGVYDDDSQIDVLHTQRGSVQKGGAVRVEIGELKTSVGD